MAGTSSSTRSAQGFLLRLYWMIAGPVVLFFCLVFLFERRPPVPAALDAAFAIAASGLIAARYTDIRWCGGCTADGQPASMQDLARYSRWITISAVAAWVLARSPMWLN